MPELHDQPSTEELLRKVAEHPHGIDARKLAEHFCSMGYSVTATQRAIRLALDKGDLALTPQLEIIVSAAAEAA